MIRAAIALPLLLAAAAAAPAAHAAPTAALQVSQTSNLTDGTRITVRGVNFQPGLEAVAVGLCRVGYTNGLNDCDLDGGATFVNIGSDGGFGPLTLTVRHQFKGIDCDTRPCEIAAAPLPGTEPPAVITANTGLAPVDFVGSQLPKQSTTAAVTVVHTTDDTRGPSTLLWALTAGLLLIVAGLATATRRRT